jgi:MFS family permease
MVLVPIYLNEIAPKSLRGAFGVTCQVFVVLGIAIAQFLSLFLSSIPYWRLIMLFGGVIGTAHFVLLLFACESPKWVALQHGGQARASSILRRIRGEDSEHEVRDWRRRSFLPTDNDGTFSILFRYTYDRCRRESSSICFRFGFDSFRVCFVTLS